MRIKIAAPNKQYKNLGILFFGLWIVLGVYLVYQPLTAALVCLAVSGMSITDWCTNSMGYLFIIFGGLALLWQGFLKK